MSMVADNISHRNYDRLIVAIKSRFNVDPTELRREQDGMDDLGLRAAFFPTEHGQTCCIDFEFQNRNHESWLNLDAAGANQIHSVLEKRRGLVFVMFHQLERMEPDFASWRILKLMTDVFDGEKVIFTPWSTKNIIAVPKVLYATHQSGSAWFDGLLLQQPDALFLPLDRDLPTLDLCRYAEEHLVVAEIFGPNFPISMPIPGSWAREHCNGLLWIDSYQRICQSCRKSYTPSPAELHDLKLTSSRPVEFSRGEGCEACRGRGLKGRQLSVALAADGSNMASLLDSYCTRAYDFWERTSPAIRNCRAQLVKDGLVASWPTLHPRYEVEVNVDLDTLT